MSIGEFVNPLDVKDVIVRSNFEQKRIYIKDIADVKDTFEDEEVHVRVNKEKSIVVSISKTSNADIIKTIDNVKNVLSELKRHNPSVNLSQKTMSIVT